MKKLLDFIDGREPEDDFTRELDEAVRSVRKNEKWRLDYMTLQMNSLFFIIYKHSAHYQI